MSNAPDPPTPPDPKLLARRFVDFARFVLDEREAGGTIRGIASERNRFARHLESTPFALKPLDEITRGDIEAWLREMSAKPAKDTRGARPISAKTIKRSLSLCKSVFVVAGPDQLGLIANDPFLGLNVGRVLQREGAQDEDDEDDEDALQFLNRDEQEAIATCQEMDDEDRLAILFALGTGLAHSEQFNLRMEDVRLLDENPHVRVRVVARGRDVMKSRERDVPLLGPSLLATRQWLEVLPTFVPENSLKLLFPSSRGGVRGSGKPLGGGGSFRAALRKAGIPRHLKWADLRSTCAASMALGYWGRRYSVADVQKVLGITNVHVMQRYATLFESHLGAAMMSPPREHTPIASMTAPGEVDDSRTVLTTHMITAGVLRAERAEIAQSSEQETSDGSETSPGVGVAAVAEPHAWHARGGLNLTEPLIAPFAMNLALPPGTLARAGAALSTGKHLLLVGPPGTGKTELADALVRAAVAEGYCAGAHVATASADWTTFDTIGGYSVQRNGRLRFRPGALLRAIEGFKWLVIDEFNRADVDRAFGELMTVLSGKTTDTTYELDGGRTVRIGPDLDASHLMPPTFRVLATMNTWDKTSLFRLSYAVQRRFAIVHVNVPDDAAYGALVRRHAKLDGQDAPLDASTVDRIVGLFSSRGLLAVRKVGPAIALDLVRYVRRRTSGEAAESPGDALAEAIAMFVLPQLDGLVQADAELAYRTVATLLRGVASRDAITELRGRFEELLPHVRLPGDEA